MSPNTKGPHCQDTGMKCDFNHSTCNGRVSTLQVTAGLDLDMCLSVCPFICLFFAVCLSVSVCPE